MCTIAYISSDVAFFVYGNKRFGFIVVTQLHNARVRKLHPEESIRRYREYNQVMQVVVNFTQKNIRCICSNYSGLSFCVHNLCISWR